MFFVLFGSYLSFNCRGPKINERARKEAHTNRTIINSDFREVGERFQDTCNLKYHKYEHCKWGTVSFRQCEARLF